MSDVSITFRDLTLGYHSHPAVHSLNGTIRRGSLTAVVGANGSGKSTLLKGVVGMLKPMQGSCTVRPGTRMAYLPQQSELDRSFPARVIDLVSLGLWPKRGFFRRHTSEDKASLSRALQSVGLGGFEERPIDTLSGGQLQRALFARVLVQDADLILLDEPFNAVDAKTVVDLIELIKRWHGEARTVLVVAHDFDLVRANFPEGLLLARKPVAWGTLPGVLAAENLLRARQFQEAWDEQAPWCETHSSAEQGLGHSVHSHAGDTRPEAIDGSHPGRAA